MSIYVAGTLIALNNLYPGNFKLQVGGNRMNP